MPSSPQRALVGSNDEPRSTTNDGRATLTANQALRRQRVLVAALKLAGEGGYDAVQMREVAATADVALGTIYRYFSSKDHLLAAAMAEWTGALQAQLLAEPPRGKAPVDRLVDVLRRACQNLERQPLLTRALITSLSSSGDDVAECTKEVERRMSAMTGTVLSGLDPEVRDGVTAVLRHVWYSGLLSWANGRMDITEVGDELERAARLLLADRRPRGPAGTRR
jgi:AcrR family transcriptional regulator